MNYTFTQEGEQQTHRLVMWWSGNIPYLLIK